MNEHTKFGQEIWRDKHGYIRIDLRMYHRGDHARLMVFYKRKHLHFIRSEYITYVLETEYTLPRADTRKERTLMMRNITEMLKLITPYPFKVRSKAL